MLIGWGELRKGLPLLHFYLSIVIVVLLTLQGAIGVLLRRKIYGRKMTESIQWLSRFHLTTGILTYLITKAELVIGLYIFNVLYVQYLLGFYAINLAFRIIQEMSYKYQGRMIKGGMKGYTQEDSQDEDHKLLLELLNNSSNPTFMTFIDHDPN